MITEAECAFSWELQLWLHRLRRPQFWGTDSSHQTPRRLLEKARACRFLHRTVGMWGLTTLSCQKTAQRVQVLREARGQEAAVGRSLPALKGLRILPAALLSLSSGDKSSNHRDWIQSLFLKSWSSFLDATLRSLSFSTFKRKLMCYLQYYIVLGMQCSDSKFL